MITTKKITAKAAKYIKLGEKGEWEDLCLQDGALRLGYYDVPHAPALINNPKQLKQYFLEAGFASKAASDHARQVQDFYNASSDTLWVTFAHGCLWWCRADDPVQFLGHDKKKYPQGSRLRQSLSGWRNYSVHGDLLEMNRLSGHLTKVSAYRQTICDIKGNAFTYLMRKINGELLPQVETAQKARQDLQEAAAELIRLLTWQDFELFVDLIFSRSGWQRISAIGSTQKTIDLELVQPLTAGKAVVQVKSHTSQSQLDEYIKRLTAYKEHSAFYVYHSADTEISAGEASVSVMGVSALADSAIRVGLVDWLLQKTA